jgi:rifampicin phosphotransferase
MPWLRDLPPDNLGRYGQKGASLGHLARASFEIPHGFVIPVEITSLLRSVATEWPQDLVRRLIEQFRDLTPNFEPVAVRSSPLAGASDEVSDQHKTVLGVVGSDAFLAALAKLMLWQGQQAVVVQKMIRVDSSGLATRIDVASGDANRIVVQAVNGSGEKMERITSEGQRYVVDRDTLTLVERPDAPALLTDAKIRWATRAVIRASDLFRAPQELEFAFDFDAKLWLFQARTIALPVASPQ